MKELDQRLAQWIKFHTDTLMQCSYHALALPNDIGRTKTHIFRVFVEPRLDHGGKASKYFRVTNATVPPIQEAMRYDSAWEIGLSTLRKQREASEAEGRGTETAVGIQCPALSVQFVPFGSITEDIKQLKIIPQWLEILKQHVEEGKRPPRKS